MDSSEVIKQAKGTMTSVKNGSVFLVDDNPVFLTILEDEIRAIFPMATIKCYTTGEEALSNIAIAHPFLIFLDYNLAGASTRIMNGISVLKKIKKEAPDTEVVMLSGISDIKIITGSMKHGAFDYILKGEKLLSDVRHDVVNILRKLRIKEETKEYNRTAEILKWMAILITVAFLFVLYVHMHPYLFF